MRKEKPSLTAQWVAMWRGLGRFFARDMRLVDDPYGLAFSPWTVKVMAACLRLLPLAGRFLFRRTPLFGLAAWLQLRTRIIDDWLRDFVESGGRQAVILGAGYDARACRLTDVLGDAIPSSCQSGFMSVASSCSPTTLTSRWPPDIFHPRWHTLFRIAVVTSPSVPQSEHLAEGSS
jgi:hypothetical protein